MVIFLKKHTFLSFIFNLSSTYFHFNNTGTGTIIDDDDPEYILIHISDAAAGENAESMTFNVTLTKPLDQDITVHTNQGSTTISAGSTSGSVTMTWSDDCDIEPDSTFSVYPSGYESKMKVAA